MEEDNNKTVETTPDISVQEESKMQTVANSRVRFKIQVVWLLVVILHYCIAFKWNKTFVEKELGRIRKQRSNQLKELERLKAQIAASKANQDAQKQE